MTDTLSQRIQALLDSEAAATLAHIRRGIEKESLRITDQGLLAHTPHPRELGSALTHPYITTDYSESLLEFITPPSTDLQQPIEFLENLHRYAYRHIDDELLWVNSMPRRCKGATDGCRCLGCGQSFGTGRGSLHGILAALCTNNMHAGALSEVR